MKIAIGICLFIINVSLLNAQDINWISSLEWGKKLAQGGDKLILVDFWAYWCPPCIKMDLEVWSDVTIRALRRNFVYVKFDVSSGFAAASPYIISAIPTIMILDGWGDVLYKSIGFKDKTRLKALVTSFPVNVSSLNRSLYDYYANQNDKNNILNVATTFQDYGVSLDNPAKNVFLNKSDEYLKKIKRQCKKNTDDFLLEKIEILKSLNTVYRGREKSAIKNITEKIRLENIQEGNQALANYVLIKAYLQLNDKFEARKYYIKLLNSDECEAFIELVQHIFEE